MVLGLLGTACVKDGDTTRQTTQGFYLYNRVVSNDGKISLSKAQTTIVIDLNNFKMAISSSVKLSNGQKVKFEIEEISLSGSNPYEFSVSSAKSTDGSTVLNGIQGKVDLSGGVMYMQYNINGTEAVYATSLIAFPYTSFNSTKDGNTYSSTSSVMFFTLNDKDSTKATMEVRNLQLSRNSSIIEDVTYDTVQVTPTVSGYKLTGSHLKNNSMGTSYDITDFNADVTDQGRVLNATFKCMGYDVKYQGQMFKSN